METLLYYCWAIFATLYWAAGQQPSCQQLDLSLVIDISQSATGEYSKDLASAAQLLNALPLGPDKTRAAVTIFATRAALVYDFNEPTDPVTFANAIRALQHLTGKPDIVQALRTAGGSIKQSARATAIKAVVIISDGQNQNNVSAIIKAIEAVETLGATIFAATNSDSPDLEALELYTSSSARVYIKNFEGLTSLLKDLTGNCIKPLDINNSSSSAEITSAPNGGGSVVSIKPIAVDNVVPQQNELRLDGSVSSPVNLIGQKAPSIGQNPKDVSAFAAFNLSLPGEPISPQDAAPNTAGCPKAEILFILDGSGTLSGLFRQQIDYLSALTNALTIGPDIQRVGLLQYSGVQRMIRFSLSDNLNKKQIVDRLQREVPYVGTTRTGAALLEAQKFMRDRRLNVPIIVIVMTDGVDSQDDPRGPADVLRFSYGAEVYAINLQYYINRKVLAGIAGSDDNVYDDKTAAVFIRKFQDRFKCNAPVDSSAEKLQPKALPVVQPTEAVNLPSVVSFSVNSNISLDGQSNDKRDSSAEASVRQSIVQFVASQNITTVGAGDESKENVEPSKRFNFILNKSPDFNVLFDSRSARDACTDADVVFVLDSSAAANNEEVYERQLQFLAALVNLMNIAPTLQRVSLIQYAGQRQIIEIPLNSNETSSGFIEYLQTLQPYRGIPRTSAALNEVQKLLLQRRAGVPFFVVLISDGNGYADDARKAAARLRAEGAKLFAVALSKPYERKQLIALTGDAKLLYASIDYLLLANLMDLSLRCLESPFIDAEPVNRTNDSSAEKEAQAALNATLELHSNFAQSQAQTQSATRAGTSTAAKTTSATVGQSGEKTTTLKANASSEESLAETTTRKSAIKTTTIESITSTVTEEETTEQTTVTERRSTKAVPKVIPNRPGTGCSKADIIFLLDTSTSVPDDFQHQLGILISLVSAMTIDQDNQRVAMVKYSSGKGVVFRFKEAISNEYVLDQLQEVKPFRSITRTGAALDFTQQLVSERRDGVQVFVVLVSDGFSVDDPYPGAEALREQGVNIIAATATQAYDAAVLEKITGDPDNVFIDTDLESLALQLEAKLRCAKGSGSGRSKLTTKQVPAATTTVEPELEESA